MLQQRIMLIHLVIDGASTTTVNIESQTFSINSGTGIDTTKSAQAILVALSDTSVSAGTYGDGTAGIAKVVIDAQGRITSASTDQLTTTSGNFSIGDNLTLGSDYAKIVMGATNQVTLAHEANKLKLTGSLEVTGDVTIAGDLTFGVGSDDTITFDADIGSDFIPSVTNTHDLGSSALKWQDLHLNGTATIGTLNTANAVITGGTFTNVAISSGSSINGLAIGNVTPSTGAFTSVDINGGAIDGTTIGVSTPSTGAFTTLTASSGVTFASATITSGVINDTTIGAITPDTGAFTTLSTTGGSVVFDDAEITSVDINGGTISGVNVSDSLTWSASQQFLSGSGIGTVGISPGSSHAFFHIGDGDVAEASLVLQSEDRSWEIITEDQKLHFKDGTTSVLSLDIGNYPFPDGRVGINIEAPLATLQIASEGVTPQFLITDAQTGESSTDGYYIHQLEDDTYHYNQEGGKMFWGTSGSPANKKRLILLPNKARLGINAQGSVDWSSPLQALHIKHTDSSVVNDTSLASSYLNGILLENAQTGMGSLGSVISFMRTGPQTGDAFIWGGSSSDTNGELQFWTENAGTNEQQMTITSTGKVGIGVVDPQSMIHISSGGASAGEQLPQIQITDSGQGVGSGDGLIVKIEEAQAFLTNRENGDLFLGTNSQNSLTLLSGGNALIGAQTGTSDNSTSRFLKIGSSAYTSSGLVLEDNESKWEIKVDDGIFMYDGNTQRFKIDEYGSCFANIVIPSDQPAVAGALRISAGDLQYYDGSSWEVAVADGESSTSSFWAQGASDRLTYMAGRVGVAVAAPAAPLDVAGAGDAQPVIYVRGSTVEFMITAYDSSNYSMVGTMSDSDLRICTNNHSAITIDTDQNVGIGTTSDYGRLSITSASSERPLGLRRTGAGEIIRWNIDSHIVGGITSSGGYGGGTGIYGGSSENETQLFLKSDGNVGIGTAADYGRLSITSESSERPLGLRRTGAGEIIRWNIDSDIVGGITSSGSGTGIYGGSVETETQLFLKSDGNVGIGTNNPSSNLEVADDAGAEIILSNTPTSQNLIADSLLGKISFVGYDTTIGSPNRAIGAQIVAYADGAWDNSSSNYSPTRLGFFVQDASTTNKVTDHTNYPRLVIDSTGNVGIGTATPDDLLTVHKGSSGATPMSEAVILIENNNHAALNILTPDNKVSSVKFGSPSDSAGASIGWSYASGLLDVGTIVNNSEGEISFNIANNVPAMRIDSSGNVGIGTASPNANLDIEDSSEAEVRIKDTGGTGYVRIYHNGTTGFIGTEGDVGFNLTTNGAPRLYILSNGNVGIGVSGPNHTLELGDADAYKTSGTTWGETSDERIKENIELADLDRCYEIVKNLPLKRFTYKDSAFSESQAKDRSVIGWIAQDVQSVFPKAVNENHFRGVVKTEGVSGVEAVEAVEAVSAKDAVYETVTKQRQKVVVTEVEEEQTSTEIVEEGGKYIQKTTTKTVTKEVSTPQYEEVKLYDEDGEEIGTHQIQVMEDYEEEVLVSEAVAPVEAVEAVEAIEAVETEYEMEIEDCLTLQADQIFKVMYGAIQGLITKVDALENA